MAERTCLLNKRTLIGYPGFESPSLRKMNRISGCSVARLSRLVWDEEVAGSNPATPTEILITSVIKLS